MGKKQEIPNKAYIWVNIDFDKVKNRINVVTSKIEQVIQKYEFSTRASDSGKRNN
ncbi:hypothetical protein H6G93_10005 [Nostoc sp. FACHB-973]|uniref:Uncharacterized protein n=1 Tax=Desmonostoc muscorum LEGE 12446 TaxID=1828758 RepID=A0A8J7A0K3_DESMC|nr:hypothetical protein [Desmonostoc muscorum]MBD2515339.1 hypothetical protein [Nostoc sp. FACHB-973]MBX9258951.1 hypothetical protein [Desmonostoc muscorum CCALA 125]MCF2150019.1 hypothetical protein [Desmonostoc muscorum LEGE 12446]